MQHEHILKKLNFDLLTPSPRVGGSAGKLFAIMLVPRSFPLILYYGKVEFRPLPYPLNPPRGGVGGRHRPSNYYPI